MTALAGCGGGGGSGGGSDVVAPIDPVPTTGPVAITTSNYEVVAREASLAASYLSEAGEMVTGAQTAPDARTLFAFTRLQVRRLPVSSLGAAQVVTGVTKTTNNPCSGGGSLSITTNIADAGGQVANGDTATVVASNCSEGGATLDGTLTMVFTAVSGDPRTEVFSATVGVTLTNLRATTAAGSVTGSGTMTLAQAGLGAGSGSLDMQVPLMTTSSTVAGVTATTTLQAWRIRSSYTPAANGLVTTSSTAEGSVTGGAMQGRSVSMVSVAPLVVLGGDVYPSSGSYSAIGASGSKVQVTALNASTARVELDADGNGSVDQSVDLPWSALR